MILVPPCVSVSILYLFICDLISQPLHLDFVQQNSPFGGADGTPECSFHAQLFR